LFTIRRVGARVYAEIPPSALNRLMLLTTTVTHMKADDFMPGQLDSRMVRWERADDRVLLRSVGAGSTADADDAVAAAIPVSNFDATLAAFSIEALSPDSAPVIEVSRFLLSPPTELSVASRYRSSLDPARSAIEAIAAHPTNIEIDVLATGTTAASSTTPSQTESYVVHSSLMLLPATPMRGRLCDDRTNAFGVRTRDYSASDRRFSRSQDSQIRCYIRRFRLERRDATAATSEPIQPIVFYMDRAIPAWARPWVRRGLESWQPAFEAAGFRNAILARDEPAAGDDPTWSPNDARHSTVRWVPSSGGNASGSNVVDPRSGEIFKAQVVIWHNVLSNLRDWYLTQAGAVDDRAWSVPMPDSLLGRLLMQIVAHETGHAIGFTHHYRASATYPLDSVRSPGFVARMGYTPSVMDNAYVHYVAQPEDGIALDDLIGRVGPWDRWAVHWSYAPIDGARTPEEERATLERWIADHRENPWYQEALPYETADRTWANPEVNAVGVGEADPIRSTALGLKNLAHVAHRLSLEQAKFDVEELRTVYNRLVEQWARELSVVAPLVGGALTDTSRGLRFLSVSGARQREAMRFLANNAFSTPTYLLDPLVLRRIELDGSVARIVGVQRRLIASLLDDSRTARLVEDEALAPDADRYSVSEYLRDLRRAIASDLMSPQKPLTPYRRALQQAFVEEVQGRLSATPRARSFFRMTGDPRGPTGELPAAVGNDLKAALRTELRDLLSDVDVAARRSSHPETVAHLRALGEQIRQALSDRGAATRP
jgi:hypothetical protein